MSGLLASLRGLDVWGVLTAALDIAIVAYFIYRVLLLIRGTRAAYMLVGLLLLAGVFFAANQLALTTVGWLLDHVITYLIIIVIIVFQADIRRGLSRIGRKMVSPSRSGESTAVIEEVVLACELMAKKRTGALIVFERDADLEEFIDQGTALEARVSKELLCNAFAPHPDNPLHDGAAIIKGRWLMQAGAILPLSRNPGLDRELGTRHRAGVGITEETDAVAVVVSEQRGAMSFCLGGVLHMGLSGAALRRELLAVLASDESSRWLWLERLMRRWESAMSGNNGMARRVGAPRRTTARHAAVAAPSETPTLEPERRTEELEVNDRRGGLA